MLLKFVDTFFTFLLKKELDILPSIHNSTIFLYFEALFCLPKNQIAVDQRPSQTNIKHPPSPFYVL